MRLMTPDDTSRSIEGEKDGKSGEARGRGTYPYAPSAGRSCLIEREVSVR